MATFVVARSELFGTKELIKKEAALVKSKTLREEVIMRKRMGKTPRGQAGPGLRGRINVEEGHIGDTSIVEEDEFKTDEASSARSS